MDDHQARDPSLLKGYISGYLRAVRTCASMTEAGDTLGPTAATKSRANGREMSIIASRIEMSAGMVEITWLPVLSSRGSEIWSMARQQPDVFVCRRFSRRSHNMLRSWDASCPETAMLQGWQLGRFDREQGHRRLRRYLPIRS